VRQDSRGGASAASTPIPYGNGTAIFTSSGEAARRFQRGVKVGMIGSQRADPGAYGVLLLRWLEGLTVRPVAHPWMDGVAFYTRSKVITSRWPTVEHPAGASYHFPVNT
jgi:malonate-semialdehyde dehydrogenase (acetylating)/methylmalonate-semialdehyde dehydrogenase